jgi:hypothetical protein
MAALPTYEITITVAPDDPNMTEEEIREWVDVVVRGIGAVVDVQIERNGETPTA